MAEVTVRFRITLFFVVVILAANTLLTLATIYHTRHVLLDEVRTRVEFDLRSAHRLLEDEVQDIAQMLRALALDHALQDGLRRGDIPALAAEASTFHRLDGTDVLAITDTQGRVLVRANNASERGDLLTWNPVVAAALRDRAPATGTVIIPRDALACEGGDLVQRAEITVLPTPAARPEPESVLRDGMALCAVVPVMGEDGSLLGALFGAELLNRRFDLVEGITSQVFQGQTHEGRAIGTATLFQGDVRIATTVLNEQGTPAVGTRLSEIVAQRVLEEGRPWNDRAFVVSDWYITAYEPIRDPEGEVVGALYVGLLEAPFRRPLWGIVSVFLLMVAATTTAILILLGVVTRHVLWPIQRVVTMAGRVVRGDLSARVQIRPPGEMGRLCAAIDAMADAVAERERQLRVATQQQIGQSEKLASIGRLAAGIAHEINNPLTGVLTFAHMLRQRPVMEEPDRHDLDVILRETTRVREIVRGLLDFARESPSARQPLDINEVIHNTLRLVRSQKEFRDVEIVESLDRHLPRILGDKNQLQQVLLNLTFNACEAMDGGGGRLSVTTEARADHVAILVADTGHGISEENLGRIFDPFYTTKPVGKGTGLGLSVSYGIVQQHGGTIDVASCVGVGTTFTIVLPAGAGDGERP
ncbi:MAG: cache domain-containing protein [Candidatus Sumerlaeia bacterium]|nr:cache domain-containing protein [Candidatus Sumerlaeia bacterium]